MNKFSCNISADQFLDLDQRNGLCFAGRQYSSMYVKSKVFPGLTKIKVVSYDEETKKEHYYIFYFDSEENLMMFQMKFL